MLTNNEFSIVLSTVLVDTHNLQTPKFRVSQNVAAGMPRNDRAWPRGLHAVDVLPGLRVGDLQTVPLVAASADVTPVVTPADTSY